MHSILRGLNEYSNLLLVVVTIVYVLVNWRMLAALKKTSSQERESRHLEDLKQHVCAPLISWLDDEVANKLNGRFPSLINTFEKHTPKEKVSIGEDPFERKMEISESLSDPTTSPMALYSDAEASHFSAELARFESLRIDFRMFAAGCAEFGRRCADEIALKTNLKRENLSVSGQAGADSDAFVVDCISSLMQGMKVPWIEFRIPAPDGLEAIARSASSRCVARGNRDEVLKWLTNSTETVKGLWEKNSFPDRVIKMRHEANEVRRQLESIMYTHVLQGDCIFIRRHRRARRSVKS